LRWNNTYGDNKVGGKFATVYHNTLKFYGTAGEPYNFNNYQYLIDIAIPKRVVGDTVGLPPKITKASNPQYLIRHTDSVGDDHYLLFNKETGNDITRGEGHEQPDQMQILYYINDDSYIVDGGYDAGGQKINSTWNGYIYHNLMHYSYNYLSTHHDGYVEYQNFGGLESPKVVVTKSRKVSEHGDVTSARFRNISDNLKAIEGEVTLSMHNAPSGYIEADYKRRLVMVLGNSPYIVDFNKIEEGYMPQQPDNNIIQKMHYYGNSNSLIM